MPASRPLGEGHQASRSARARGFFIGAAAGITRLRQPDLLGFIE
jgi:hypothetical protein